MTPGHQRIRDLAIISSDTGNNVTACSVVLGPVRVRKNVVVHVTNMTTGS